MGYYTAVKTSGVYIYAKMLQYVWTYKNYAKGKKPEEGQVLYDLTYMKYLV